MNNAIKYMLMFGSGFGIGYLISEYKHKEDMKNISKDLRNIVDEFEEETITAEDIIKNNGYAKNKSDDDSDEVFDNDAAKDEMMNKYDKRYSTQPLSKEPIDIEFMSSKEIELTDEFDLYVTERLSYYPNDNLFEDSTGDVLSPNEVSNIVGSLDYIKAFRNGGDTINIVNYENLTIYELNNTYEDYNNPIDPSENLG